MGLLSLYDWVADSAQRTLFLQQIQVLHYMPGRVRLYVKQVNNKPEIAAQVRAYLEKMPEIKEFSINTATGSILIHYSPEGVLQNPFLRDLEERVARQYGRL